MTIHSSRALLTLVPLLASLAACGGSTQAASLPVGGVPHISSGELYQALYGIPISERARLVAAASRLTINEVYTAALAHSDDSGWSLNGIDLANAHTLLSHGADYYEALDGAYSNLGSYWRGVGYDPMSALPEREVTALLRQIFTSNLRDSSSLQLVSESLGRLPQKCNILSRDLIVSPGPPSDTAKQATMISPLAPTAVESLATEVGSPPLLGLWRVPTVEAQTALTWMRNYDALVMAAPVTDGHWRRTQSVALPGATLRKSIYPDAGAVIRAISTPNLYQSVTLRRDGYCTTWTLEL